MDTAIQAKIDTWLTGNFDNATKDEIKRLQLEKPDELADAFYQNLEFGTGGLRGLMGVAMPTVYLFIRLVPTPIRPRRPPVPNSRF